MEIKRLDKVECNYEEEVPLLFFDDVEPKVEFGKWLGLLPKKNYKIFNSKKITNRQDKKISHLVGEIFGLAGIDPYEVCICNDFKVEETGNFKFNCFLFNDNKDISVRVINSDGDAREIIFVDGNVSKTYLYTVDYDNSIYLRPQEITIKNEKTGYKYNREISFYEGKMSLEDGKDNKLTVFFTTNNKFGVSIKSAVSLFDNEEQLEEYILGLTLPIEFDKAIGQILNITNINNCVRFEIRNEQKNNNGVYETRNLIELKRDFDNGDDFYINTFIFTREGKKITVNKDGELSYEYVDTNNTGYTFDEISASATAEIESTKKFLKSIYSK